MLKVVSKVPVGIPAFKGQADLVRNAALELGLRYVEQEVPGRDDAIRFVFEPLDESTRLELALKVPQNALCLDAVAAGGDRHSASAPGASEASRSASLFRMIGTIISVVFAGYLVLQCVVIFRLLAAASWAK